MPPASTKPETSEASPGYRAILESAGLLAQPARVLIRVTGEQAPQMLHGLVTNEVNGLSGGQAVYAFMLTPKGRVVAEMRVIRRPDEIWLDLPERCAKAGLSHLEKYLPPIFAVFERTDIRRIDVIGPSAGAVLDAWSKQPLGADLQPLRCEEIERDGLPTVAIGREKIEGPGFDVYVRNDVYEEALGGLRAATLDCDGADATDADWDVRRVERGIPVWGPDFSDSDLAQEVAQDERAISFDKGCYTGQEVVARIHFRGHVNRILRGFRLLSSDLLPGQVLYEAGRERGRLGTTVVSPRHGPIALGLARTELAAGTLLALEPAGEPKIELLELPFS